MSKIEQGTIEGNLKAKRPKGYWSVEMIEREASEFAAVNGFISFQTLREAGRIDLESAILKRYPGHLKALRNRLGVSSNIKDSKGNVRWSRILPDQRNALIENEAEQIFSALGKFDSTVLKDNSPLDNAIRRYYPNGMVGIKTYLNYHSESKPIGFWSAERIEEEARAFYLNHGDLSQRLLLLNGRADLMGAIGNHYPNKLGGLKNKLDIKPKYKLNHWTKEQIEHEATVFFQENGKLSAALLNAKGRSDLANAIFKLYPGKIRQLQQSIGSPTNKMPNSYWTPENIESEVIEYLKQQEDNNSRILNRRLLGIIRHYYPGGLARLREKFEIDVKKPKGYWTPEKIEEQAKAFIETYGYLTQSGLIKQGRQDLASVISKYYPSGLTALKEKLGINLSPHFAQIDTIQANEQLRRLLEGVQNE